jgi:4-hydroxy-tetrahydrodipicolinate synthase
MFAGTFTALITPFRDGALDHGAFKALIDRQVAAGITGIVPVGTTGESPTLDSNEHLEVIRAAVEYADKRLLVVAGSGANSTTKLSISLKLPKKPGQTPHFKFALITTSPLKMASISTIRQLQQILGFQLCFTQFPGRSVIEISIETIARLANNCENIVANKEAGGSVDRINQLVQAVPEDFQILSGDDPLTLPFHVMRGGRPR